jgi:integrase
MKVYPHVRGEKNSHGQYTVYVVINVAVGRLTVDSGLRTSILFKGNAFPQKEPNGKVKTARLNTILQEVERVCLENTGKPKDVLKGIIMSEVLGKKKANDKTLAVYLRDYMAKCKTTRTKELYEATARKVEKYDKNATLQIDASWLSRFESWMARDNKINAYAIHLRNIRTVMNWAIENGWTENYPFRRFKIKHEATRKRNLSAQFIHDLMFREVEPFQERYRDLFVMSFLLIGVNPVDLLNAEPSQLSEGRFEYVRAKTHKLYSIKVEPEAQALIDKYKGEKHMLNYTDKAAYKPICGKANVFLKTVRNDITMYYARHSWASIASELDIPMETISAALGHSFGNATTAIYINYQQKKVDDANRKVIDYVLGK